ncbi:N-acetylmuramoyl-L-alanine amidase [Pedobacter nototheniae]|uniref:N-acetylmuramoyl-L-alanine amidase n=1 Tax=Pedobacter nototheniae TaxID=2488994 RepID=UPI00103D342D|nr:N-acetylmuramoyl-L-alanine amidase [Pedobacter nototheniae]
MENETLVKKAQEAMNRKGANLKVDGKWGPKSTAAAEDFEFKVEAIRDNASMPADIAMVNKTIAGITEPVFVTVKGIKFKDRGNYATPSEKFKGLTVHYTVSGRTAANAEGVINYLKNEGFGCMVMDENGIIYIPEQFDIFKNWNYHSGVSKWKGITNVSDYFAGMEICCWGLGSAVGPYREVKVAEGYIVAGKYQKYTEAQEKSLINFILWAKSKNDEFDLDYVAGHDELRKEAGKVNDKQDPGGSLSMPMAALRDLVKAKATELGI